MGLVITTPQIQEPVTLKDLKDHVRVVDPLDYSRLSQMGIAAREWCEAYLGQQLCTATYRWTLDRFINLYLYQASLWTQQIWPWYFQSQSLVGNRLPNTWYMLWFPRNPVQSVTSIQYIDINGALQTLDPSLYIVDTESTQGRLSPAFGRYWPPTQMQIDAVKITYVAGYSNVPSAIRLAICELAAAWFDQREAVSFEMPSVVPFGVKAKLDAYATGSYLAL